MYNLVYKGMVIILKDYKIIISEDDKEFVGNYGIQVESIIKATREAIWKIKSVNSEGVDFMQHFNEGNKEFVLHGNVKRYRKQGYILEIEGISVVHAIYAKG